VGFTRGIYQRREKMNLKQAKKLRKSIYGRVGQGKTEYEEVNAARRVRMTIEGPEAYAVKNCFFEDIKRVAQKAYDTIFYPAGTTQCIGPRRIYQIMKAMGVTE
jgi:hypothetical protein